VARLKSEFQIEKFEREAMAHLDALMRVASKLMRGRQDAEDIVQETYLRAWKYFSSFDDGSNCRAWLFRIMFNVINLRTGKQAKLAESPLDDEDHTEYERTNVVTFDPVRQLEGRELLDATQKLSEEHRSVLWLVVIEEFSYKEAAEILDVPIGTVMSRLHRARRDLRKIMMTSGYNELSNSA
jgi:RNA polymerase sigma-70 factor (ECF subfamily)